jgi:hypothetical protein
MITSSAFTGEINVKKILIAMAFAASAAHSATLVESANKNGFTACNDSLKSIEDFLTENKDYTYQSTFNVSAANSHQYVITAETHYADGSVLSTVVATPAKQATCDITYTRTWIVNAPCASLLSAKKPYFDSYVNYGSMQSSVFHIAFGKKRDIHAYLLPSTDSKTCVVTKTETLYDF